MPTKLADQFTVLSSGWRNSRSYLFVLKTATFMGANGGLYFSAVQLAGEAGAQITWFIQIPIKSLLSFRHLNYMQSSHFNQSVR